MSLRIRGVPFLRNNMHKLSRFILPIYVFGAVVSGSTFCISLVALGGALS